MKIPKFVNCKFIIYKNGNKTSKQPILQSNSTSFMFNNIFYEMNIKRVIHLGGEGEWRNRHNFFLEVYLQYLLGYPSLLLWYQSNIHTFTTSIGSWSVVIIFSIIHVIMNRSDEMSCFWSLQSLLLPQFSTYRNLTGFIVKIKQVRIPNYFGSVSFFFNF